MLNKGGISRNRVFGGPRLPGAAGGCEAGSIPGPLSDDCSSDDII